MIGAGSIVTKDLPAYSIAVGIPAKVIKYRFDLEKRKQLEDFCWWNAPISLIRQNIGFFQKKDFQLQSIIELKHKLSKAVPSQVGT